MSSDAGHRMLSVLDALFKEVERTKEMVFDYLLQFRAKSRLFSRGGLPRKTSGNLGDTMAKTLREKLKQRAIELRRKFSHGRTIYHPRCTFFLWKDQVYRTYLRYLTLYS